MRLLNRILNRNLTATRSRLASALLNLNFLSGNLDNRVSFGRSTNATVTNSSGLIQPAPHNLLTHSEQFDNAVWAKSNVAITANAVAAPDGTITADLMSCNLTGINTGIFVAASPTVGNSISIYAKKANSNILGISGNNAGNYYAYFDLNAGTVGNNAQCTASIQDVGNGWYRCVLSNLTVSSGFITISPANASAAAPSWTSTSSLGNSIYVWGAQLETNSTATAYNSTTVKNLLGFTEHFDAAAWTKSNAFVQTNLLLYSQDFDNAAWTKTALTVTANSTNAPDSTTTAESLVEGSGTVQPVIYQLVSSIAGTFSVYVKANGRNFAQILNSAAYANFDLFAGTVGSVSGFTNAAITSVGAGWYRISATVPVSTVVGVALVASSTATYRQSYTGDGTSGLFIWGAQFVQGTSPGDYKATYGSVAAIGYTDIYNQPFAQKLVESAATSTHFVRQDNILGYPVGVYTFSVYAKADTRPGVVLICSGAAVRATAGFNLLNGTVRAEVTAGTSTMSSSIQAVGGGWYRCAVTFNFAAAPNNLQIGVDDGTSTLDGNGVSYTGNGTSGIYIFGAQLSDSASVDPYVYQPVAAPASTAYYGPRLNYDASAATYADVFGPELVTNGDLSSSANWSVSGGWSIAGGAASINAPGNLTQNALALLVQNKLVKITYTITSTFSGGGVAPYFQQTTPSAINVFGTYRTAVGTYTEYLQVPINATVFGFNSGSTSGSIDNISVKEIVGITGTGTVPKGLLIEEQRTNLITYSEQFDNAAWTKTGLNAFGSGSVANTVATNDPSGGNTAEFIQESTANTRHEVAQTITAANGVYTHVCYIKAGGRTSALLSMSDGTSGDASWGFNLSTGQLITYAIGVGSWTNITATINAIGNGWYRCSVTATKNAGSSVIAKVLCFNGSNFSYTGDGTSGIYIWGAQLETGAFATSYIPTVASQVTRAADNASMIGNNFARWYNPTSGTVLVKYDYLATGSRTALEFSDGTSNNSMRYASDALYTGTQVVTGGVVQANLIPAFSVAKTPYSLSGSYSRNNFIAVDTGDAADFDNSGTVPVTSLVRLGNDVSNNYLNGHIAGFAYFNRALTSKEQTSLVNGVYELDVPAALFAAGEQGWVYDPSNLATLFQDSAGSLPVTAMEQPVGLQLDLSQGLVLGPELVTNGDFSGGTTTGWAIYGDSVLAASAGKFSVTVNQTSAGAQQTITTQVGKTYKVTCDFSDIVSLTGVRIAVYTPGFGTGLFAPATNDPSPGVRTGYFVATTTTSVVLLQGYPTGSFKADNITVKAISGNHRFQTADANRPVVSARVNLLTKTEQFDDAAWPKADVTVAANATTAPDGTATADKLIASATNANHLLNRTSAFVVATGIPYVFKMYAKANEYGFVRLQLQATSFSESWANFNLITGAVGLSLGVTPTIQPAGNGWYLCSITSTSTGTGNSGVQPFVLDSDRNGSNPSYLGDGTSGIFIWGADFRPTNQGVGLPAYQRVNTSTDYDSTGFPVYIKPNGSNQFMVTNSINFTATDKVTVWQGVRKLSDAAAVMLTELSVNLNSNAGTFFLLSPGNANQPDYVSSSRGTAAAAANQASTATSYASPITNVISTTHDIAGDLTTLRVNQVAATNATGDKGTGNFGNYPAYFYARGGTSLFFNGHDYGSIVRGAASTGGQIAAAETWINARTAAYTTLVETFDLVTTDAGDQIVTDAGDAVFVNSYFI